jgi:serpin B
MNVSRYPRSISESSRSNPARPRLLRMEPLEDRLLLSARAVNAVNQFGLDVYEHLQNEQGNLFFSPLSIATGLAMAYEGAAGQTAAEIEQVLHLGSEPGIHTSFQSLLATLEAQEVVTPGEPAEIELQLDLANAMWPQVGLPLESSFLNTIQTSYDGYAESLDYVLNPQQAEDTINAWVSQQTQGKIQNLVDGLSSLTRMVLTNTVYFKGQWESPFDPRYTYTGQFTLADGQTVSTPTMYTEMYAYHTELDGFQILDLPFVEENASMVLVLPPVGDPSTQLTSEVISGIDNWFAGTRDQGDYETLITLPKFQTTVATSLNQLLVGLGMPTAFDGAADFSGMTSASVYIDKVFHKATLEVNEQGTEAAAATEIDFVICFAAGTPVLTPEGEKPIEELKVGDQVLARDEFNVEAAAEPKVVEKTYQSTAEIVELHVDGQVLRTTGPHRFFAKGKGWTPASELKEKDLLSTNYRDWAEVEKIVNTDNELPVYNLSVADHRTYFVGSESWGFAVWAHNSCGGEPEFSATRPFHMLIRDNATSAVTFMGRIDDPTQLQNDLDPTVVETNADFDSDGDVDGFDFLTLQRGYGITTGAELTDGDSDANGTVDTTDMAEWAAAYGDFASDFALPGDFDAGNDVDGGELLTWQQGSDTIYDASDLAALQNNYGQIAQQVAAASSGGQEDSGDLIASDSNASLLDAAFATQWLGVSHDQAEAAVTRQTITEEVFADSYKSASRTTDAHDPTDGISAGTTPEQAEDSDQSWLSDNLLEKVFGESASRLALVR